MLVLNSIILNLFTAFQFSLSLLFKSLPQTTLLLFFNFGDIRE